MEKKHVIIESFEGYRVARNKLDEQNVSWHTTSPGVLELLTAEGVSVQSLEMDLKQSQHDAVGHAAFTFAERASALLDKCCGWRRYIRFDLALGYAMAQLYYVLFYKGLLLAQEAERCRGCIACVGNYKVRPAVGLNLMFDRFDTIYALLAERVRNGMEVIEFEEEHNRIKRLETWVAYRPMERWEKILSILNNTPSSFLYKIWCHFAARGMFRTVRLRSDKCSDLFILKDCELIAENFLGFLRRGARCRKMPKLAGPPSPGNTSTPLPRKDELFSLLSDLGLKSAEEHGLEFGARTDVTKACADIAAERICCLLSELHDGFDEITRNFKKIKKAVGEGWIATNFLTSVYERLFGLYCLENNVKLAAFEHGISLGLSKWDEYPARYSGMLIAKAGIYHWEKSVSTLEPWLDSQKIICAGVPVVTRKVLLPKVQKFLARKWLGARSKEHIIVYVAGAERNNLVYGPYVENDFKYMHDTETIVESLAKNHPNSTVYLKLYPTHRYPESYKFKDLIRKYPNLKLLKDMDFRFIRSAMDIITLSMMQSTLGWALGSGKPVFLYEKECEPSKIQINDDDTSLKGVCRIVTLNSDFLNQKSDKIPVALFG